MSHLRTMLALALLLTMSVLPNLAWSPLNCVSRTSRDFSVYASLYDSSLKQLWIVSNKEVLRVDQTEVVNTSPATIQIGKVVMQPHGLNVEQLSRENLIGLFLIEKGIYVATNKRGSNRKDATFLQVTMSLFSV
jgi:hypothetical protein